MRELSEILISAPITQLLRNGFSFEGAVDRFAPIGTTQLDNGL